MHKKGSIILYVLLLGVSVVLAVSLSSTQVVDVFQVEHSPEESILETIPNVDEPKVAKTSTTSTQVDDSTQSETSPSHQKEQPEEVVVDTASETAQEPVYTETLDQSVNEVTKAEPVAATPEPLVIPEKYVSHEKNALEASEILYYTNLQRSSFGIRELIPNDLLMQAATAKVNDMLDKQYFEHVAPDGKDVMYWAGEVGYEYILVGENLAMGNFKDEEAMVTAWMESPGHRENILKTSYDEIGIAVGRGDYLGNTVWMGVQIFGTPLSACPSVDQLLLTKIKAKQAIIDSLELRISLQYPEISNLSQPSSQEEYEKFVAQVTAYNNLVEQHRDEVTAISEIIVVYNNQVQEYNTCIATK
jgi:uncharacterized protein YkwD